MIAEAKLSEIRPIILDGGTGTEIRARGYALHPSAWSALAHIERPDLVLDVHHDFLAAGAEIVTANTFSLSRHNLEHAGIGNRFIESNLQAMKLAREAVDALVDRQALVAGSISTIPPMDAPNYLQTGNSAFQNYKDQAEILAGAGADLILAEMLLEVESASVLLEAAQTVGLPVWAGLSAMFGDDETVMGFRTPGKYLHVKDNRFSDLVQTVAGFPVELVAVMHTKMDVMPAALTVVKQGWDGPVAAYAETGQSGDSDWFFDTAAAPEAYASAAVEWVQDFDVDAVGGCCGTRPAHISALAAAVGRA